MKCKMGLGFRGLGFGGLGFRMLPFKVSGLDCKVLGDKGKEGKQKGYHNFARLRYWGGYTHRHRYIPQPQTLHPEPGGRDPILHPIKKMSKLRL